MGQGKPGHQHQIQIPSGNGGVLDADVGQDALDGPAQFRLDQLLGHQADHLRIGPGGPAQS